MNPRHVITALKVVIWLGALSPAAWLALGYVYDWLGPNPIEKLTHVTGRTALSLLLITLLVTPVRKLTGWNRLLLVRRPLGLFAFFYVCLHFSVWAGLDMTLMLEWMAEDVAERPYITVGFTAFLILIPLAVTSTRGWIRRLGRRWNLIHKGIYVASILAVVHFYWLVKADVSDPLLFAAGLGLLLGYRVWAWAREMLKRKEAGRNEQEQVEAEG